MKKIILFSLLESFYVYYMYNNFKTKVSFHNPVEILIQKGNTTDYFRHPISTNIYESKICPLGKFVSKILVLWIFGRFFLNKNKMLKYNKILFIILSLSTLIMNMNSFIYYIPIYIYEFFIFPKLNF